MATLKNRRQRIRLVLAHDIGRAAMNRLVHADLAANTRRRQHADGTREHRRFVAENIAEHIGRHEDVELLRIANQLHGAVIDQDMFQLDAGVAFVFVDPRDDLAPQFGDLEHVGFIDRRDFLAPLERRLKRHVRDTFDLRRRVNFGINAPLGAVRKFGHALGLAEINSAGELAHDEKIRALDHFALERRCRSQRGK